MTPNEKAATFIGWKPEQKCAPRWCAMRLDACPRCGATDIEWKGGILQGELYQITPHDIPAPPMDDPRNYIKALENSLPSIPGSGISLALQLAFTHALEQRSSKPLVDYLVALYDAKHPEQAPESSLET